MMGHGYHDTQPPQLVNSRTGEGGFSMHGGPYTAPLPSFHSVSSLGRCHTEQVNLGWQLSSTTAADGGFQVLVGSHVGNYELPWEDHESIDHPLVRAVPAMAGSVVFFMGGAVIHGVADTFFIRTVCAPGAFSAVCKAWVDIWHEQRMKQLEQTDAEEKRDK